MSESDPKHDSTILAYEAPIAERPASAAPTEEELDREIPGAVETAGHDPYLALRNPDYRLYTVGWLVAMMGHQIQAAAISWDIYTRTNDPMALAYIGLAHLIPTLLLALPAGQLADYLDRRWILFLSTAVSGVCSLGLAAVSLGWAAPSSEQSLAWLDIGPLGMMYGLLTFSAAALTVGRPARVALLPQIVPPRVFSNAVTWNTSLFQLAAMGGPAAGGAIIWYSVPLAYLFAAAGAAVFCVLLLLIRRPYATQQREPPSLRGLMEGVRFVFVNKIVLATLTLDMFAVLFGSVTILLPIFARDIIAGGEGGEVAYGWLRAAPAVGAFGMALLLAHLPPMRKAGRTLLWSVAGFGATTVVFGLSTSFWLSFVMLILTGAFDNVSVVVRHTLVQLLTPDSLRGRVSSVNQVFIGSSNELGGVRAGAMAGWIGVVPSVVIGGLGTLAVVAAVAARWPAVRRFGSLTFAAPPVPANPAAPARTR